MRTDLLIHLSVCLFLIMHNLISGNQICSKLEFVQGSKKIVTVEGSVVNLTFYLDTKQCSTNQTRYDIKVSRENNGRHTDICKIILDKTCTVSRYSVGCSCLAPLGPMLFSRNVTSDDNNTVYVWKWGGFSPGEERRITFETTSAAAKTDRVQGIESKNDNSMVVVISTTGACLVVITAVVITFIACCRRVAERGFDETRVRHGGNKGIIVSYTPDTPPTGKTVGDPGRDTYEEIEDAPKPHGRCRVSLRTGVSLPPIPVSHLYVETPCSTPGSQREIQEHSVEYLHPLVVAGTRAEEMAEFRVVSCAQSQAHYRPLSSSM
ncbi:uncharacterized protein LOC112567702 isoform X1 [Pomacea canaliculata]|uniref:uncharacterized protein LOC112567702 isoform X1 n=1 Tax=Pomacea canaliculata TaxID=400727 RepID=UPI000D726315|nr:uncharacterized protein LOC112567702 isoform X1 [Pomacea canaliculata]